MTTTTAPNTTGLVRAEFKSANQLEKLHHHDVWLTEDFAAELGGMPVHASKYVIWGTPEALQFMAENIMDTVSTLDLAPASSRLASWVSVARILFEAADLGVPDWCRGTRVLQGRGL